MDIIAKIYEQMVGIKPIDGLHPFKSTDGKYLVDIDKKSYKTPFNDENSFNTDGANTIVHHTNGFPSGYLMSFNIKHPETHNRGQDYIYSVAVDPDHRGKNISDNLIQHAKDSGNDLHLHVRVGNTKAINLYKKHGFEVDHTIPQHYGDGEDAHYMVFRNVEGK